MNINSIVKIVVFLLSLILAGCSFNVDCKIDQEKEYIESISSRSIFDGTNGNLIYLESSIENGEKEVTVGQPIEVTYSQVINPNFVSAENFYLKTITGVVIPTRIIVEDFRVILVPQIKEQPKDELIANMGGVIIQFINEDIDYGLYWYGSEGECEKYFAEYNNAFYDETKKTMIYSHGWQPLSTVMSDAYGRSYFKHEIFNWNEPLTLGKPEYSGLNVWTNNGWLDKGWNTGIVYWTQFADEIPLTGDDITGVHDAEAKIWCLSGNQGSRYRTIDEYGFGEYKYWDKKYKFDGQIYDIESVNELLYIPVSHALQNNTSENIRLVGHSLGSQLITSLAFSLYQDGIDIKRLALLDAAFTSFPKSYLPTDNYGDSTGERVRNYIFEMMDKNPNFVVESYHTTPLNVPTGLMDCNYTLWNKVCDIDMKPRYLGVVQEVEKHNCIRGSYFLTMEFNPPLECSTLLGIKHLTGDITASASTPDWRIASMMDSEYRWVQAEGQFTPTPADDWFNKEINLF